MKRKVAVIKEYVCSEDCTPAQKWLVSILNRSGFTQAELARRCHVARQTITNFTNGNYKPTFQMVCTICYASGLDDPEEVWHEISL